MGRTAGWVVVAAALFLMAVWQGLSLFRWLAGDPSGTPELSAAWITLAISLLMVVGFAWIVPIFHSARRYQKEMRVANRALKVLSECNKAVIRATSEADLLEEICEILVEIGSYRFAWVGFLQGDAQRQVRPAAQRGFEAEYFDGIETSWSETEIDASPLGTAIQTAEPCLARNSLDDPILEPLRAEGGQSDYAAKIILPLLDKDKVFGVLSVYAVTAEAFDEQEVALLTELASDLAYGLVALRTQQRQRASEAKIRELKEFNENILQNMMEGVAVQAETGIFTFVNQATERMLGYEVGELVGQDWRLIVPEDQQHIVEEADKRRERGKADMYELELFRKDGSRLPILVSGRPQYEGDELAGTLAVFIDISERKQAEEELRKRSGQQEALNTIISAATVAPNLSSLLETALRHTMRALGLEMGGIWVRDQIAIQGLPQEIGPAIEHEIQEAQLDMSETIIVEDWQAVTSEGSLEKILELMSRYKIQSSLVVPIVIKGKRIGGVGLASPGARAWPEVEVALVEAVGWQVGSAAERMALMETVQEQADQVQHILDTVQEGIFTIDSERHIVLANPAGRDYLDALSATEGRGEIKKLGGKPVKDFLAPRPDGLPHEVTLGSPPERIFEVHVNPTRRYPDQEGWTFLLRDVTEERKLQRQTQLQDRLAAVGQLAAGIAHDFNNIMGAIILYSDMLLQDDAFPEAYRDRLKTIFQQSQRATSLIQQILDFSRRSIMKPYPMDMVPFLKEFKRLLERILPENIHLELDYEGEGFVVRADPGRFQQVLMNLALNARDAMPEGGNLDIRLRRLKIRHGERPIFRDMPSGEWILLSVSDTGAGIPPEDLPHVFEPFFTTKAPGEGTGLGLAQVYGIVKQHEGYIDVTSYAEAGTTFLIYLPALSVSAEKGTGSLRDKPPLKGRRETILVVEDDAATLEAIGEVLNSLNYEVMTATDGSEALETFAEHQDRIDLVLTDLVMPTMGGMELYRTLREHHPALGLVIMTGYPLGRGTRELLEHERVRWVKKPLSADVLAETVRDALEAAPDQAVE
jgi:PAS domain S-box-containing protein